MTISPEARRAIGKILVDITPPWLYELMVKKSINGELSRDGYLATYADIAIERLRMLPTTSSLLDAYLDDPTDERLAVLETMATVGGVFH